MMICAMKNIKNLSLNKKLLLTALILVLYRGMSHIPLPFVNSEFIKSVFEDNTSMGMLNLLTGGNLESMSIVAMGITPYITASIVIQLLGVCFPSIANMQKEGSTGQEKIKKATIILGAVLGLMQGVSMMYVYGKQGLLVEVNWFTILIPAIIMTLGVRFLSFLGQYMTDNLFGNGVSLILVTGILCSYLKDGGMLYGALTVGHTQNEKIFNIALAIISIFVLFAFTIWLMYCEKRVNIIYSGKVKSDADSIATESYIPIKLVGGSVVPVIFAASIMTIPTLIESFMKTGNKWFNIFDMTKWLNPDYTYANIGILIYFALIIAFSYYYQALNLNETELAVTLKKRGGVIENVRPGKPTELYLKKEMRVLTLAGAFGLCVVATIPICVTGLLGLGRLSFLGTSIIIVVSVMLDLGDRYIAARKNEKYKKKGCYLGA